jgi:hypothetical protein
MKTTHRLLLIAALTLPFVAACTKEEEAPAKVEAPALTAPATKDDAAWTAYLTDVIKRNAEGALNIYAYTLPPTDTEDYQGAYDRQLGEAQTAMMRGGVEGTLIAFGSSDSAKSADLAVASLQKAAPDSLKGTRVLFIGAAADSARVEEAVKPTGATYKFVEAR